MFALAEQFHPLPYTFNTLEKTTMRYAYFIGVLALAAVALPLGPIGWIVAGVAWYAYGRAYWRKPAEPAT